MLAGYTSGGSPIFYNTYTNRSSKGKRVLYSCSADERHRLTKNQAQSSGYCCTMCGADLKVKKQKLQELQNEAARLGYTLNKIK